MDFDRDIVAVYFALQGIARKYFRDERAHDLAAEAVTRALEHRDQYDPDKPLLAWCRAIMHHLWVNTGHKLETINTVPLGDMDLGGGVPPDVEVENHEALTAVQCLCTASVAVDTLYEFALGYSLNEIAERRGIPLGTVKRRIHDGRSMLSRRFSPHHVPSSRRSCP